MKNLVTSSDYRRRRKALLGALPEGAIAVVPGAAEARRNRDVFYPFRQDSNFYYLTGFCEPDAVLVLLPGREHGETLLFCRDRDPKAELYDGERLGPERAAQVLGVDDAFPIGDMEDILPNLLEGREQIYACLGEQPQMDAKLLGWTRDLRAREMHGASPPGEMIELGELLHEMRLLKSAAELRAMRASAEITVRAHERAMAAVEPGMLESQLEAELVYEFMRSGARSPAYPSIVGAGNNACVLHYIENSGTIRDGDLVLIDAGSEYQHYAADVTRTFPANGAFSAPQQAIYEVVLAAQDAAIKACVAGADFDAPDRAASEVMVQGLVDLKLLDGSPSDLMEAGHHKRFCPHLASHWLGIDVHDVGDYRIEGAWRQLEPGMVLTVEPGIYLADHEANTDVPKRYRGIGVRIEDDVVVTAGAPEVLTAAAPKSVADVERAVNGG